MAISLAFGVLFATFITLILVPSLYAILEDFRRALGRLLGGRPEETEAPVPLPDSQPGPVDGDDGGLIPAPKLSLTEGLADERRSGAHDRLEERSAARLQRDMCLLR